MSDSDPKEGKLLEWPGPRSSIQNLRRKLVSIARGPRFGVPRPLFAAWEEIAAEIKMARSVAVLSDFDGTLASIRRRPESVQMSERVRKALALLAKRGALVGVVSGRSLADVRRRVGLSGICYVGCHGYLMESSRGHVVTLVHRGEKKLLARVRRELGAKLKDLSGIELEIKEAGIAIHYRGANRRNTRAARSVVKEMAARHRRLHLLEGKKVWEFVPGPGVDKWTAVRFLLALEDRADPIVIYIGDDMTDEHVFSHMRGVSVAVGKRRRTAAKFYVQSPSDVRRFLEKLSEAIR